MDVKKSQAHLLEDLVIAWLNAEPHRIPSIRDSQEHMVFSICFELIKQFKIYIPKFKRSGDQTVSARQQWHRIRRGRSLLRFH